MGPNMKMSYVYDAFLAQSSPCCEKPTRRTDADICSFLTVAPFKLWQPSRFGYYATRLLPNGNSHNCTKDDAVMMQIISKNGYCPLLIFDIFGRVVCCQKRQKLGHFKDNTGLVTVTSSGNGESITVTNCHSNHIIF